MELILTVLELAGTVVFAVSGALAAARQRMDLFGFVVLATVTGIGGGTLRDLLLGIRPVRWVAEPTVVLLCAATALVAFLVVPRLEARLAVLLWADAVGMAVFAVTSARAAQELGVHVVPGVAMGVLTAAGGGVIRDVLSGESPLILHRDIYAMAALSGGATYWFLARAGLAPELAVPAGCLVAFGLRAASLRRGWSLPAYGRWRRDGRDDGRDEDRRAGGTEGRR